MQLKVLGTGSKGNCYILENENEALIIECGINIRSIKEGLNFNISKVSGCLVTHEHLDHASSINEVARLGIDVYATAGTFNGFRSNRAKVIKQLEEFNIGSFKIKAFDVKHDAREPVGFLINHEETGNILFLTDTFYCPYTFDNLHNIIIEANYSHERMRVRLSRHDFLKNRIMKSHMSLDTCIGFLKANDLREVNNIVLIHLSDGNSDEVLFRTEVTKATAKNVVVSDNGLVMDLNKKPF